MVMDFNNVAADDLRRSDDPSISSTISTSNHRKCSTAKEASPHLTKNIDTSRPKKTVRFNSRVNVRNVSTHRRYSPKERTDMWYSAEESKQIRSEAIATVRKMMKRIPIDHDSNECSRGLEFKTPKKNKIRQTRKMDIICSVLLEQDYQAGKPNNDEFIAEVYTSCSRSCIAEATRRGAMDAIAAWGCFDL